MEEVKLSMLKWVWKKLIPTLEYPVTLCNSEGFMTSVEEVTAHVVLTARELELEVEPEDVTKLQQLRIKLEWMSSFFLGKCMTVVSWEESTPGEDAIKIVKMTTKDLEDYMNLVDKSNGGVWEKWLRFWKIFYCE